MTIIFYKRGTVYIIPFGHGYKNPGVAYKKKSRLGAVYVCPYILLTNNNIKYTSKLFEPSSVIGGKEKTTNEH